MAIARSVHHRVYSLLSRSHGKLSRMVGNLLPHNLHPSQAMALVYLGYHNGCQLSELAKGIGVHNAAVSGLVDRMQKSGFVNRKAMLSDGRGKTVHLTDKGLLARETVMDILRDIDARLIQGFTDKELETIFKFLSRAAELEPV